MSTSRLLVVAVAGACVAVLVVVVVRGSEPDGGWASVVAVTLALAVTALLAWHLPRHPVTILLTVYVGSQFTSLGLELLPPVIPDEIESRLGNALWAGSLPVLALLITVFPDGVPTDRWRRLFQLQVATVIVLVASALAAPPNLHPAIFIVGVACGVALIGTALLSAVRLVVRAARDRAIRGQIAPFAVLAGLIVASYVMVAPIVLITGVDRAAVDAVVYPLVVGALPAAVGYAVMRHRLFGIDIIVSRLLVATTAIALLASGYLAGVYGVAAMLGVPRDSLPALLVPAALVAFVLVPAYRWIHQAITRAVYGRRGDPVAVLNTLGHELARTAPDDVPSRIVTVVHDTLRLPWVALDVDQDGTFERVAEAGTASGGAAVEKFDLAYAGAVPGRLIVQPRRGERTLGRLDRRLIGSVADQAGPAVAAARYVDELIRSRERLVLGREEERARLRRDLHDGLGPALAGISLALSAARRMLRADPPAADTLLRTAESEAGRSWADVRRIVDDLRPPGLDELGLVGALEERGRSLTRPGEFAVTIIATDLPPLPRAIETAAFRVAVEAMTNSARHAHARRCQVAVSADGLLHLTVRDDGIGLSAQPSPGVGVQSMQARVADVGGQLRLGTADGGGTLVAADLPLASTP